MWRRVSTEVQGWRDALSDPAVLLTVAARVICVALGAAGVVLLAWAAGAPVAVLASAGTALLGSLVLLRARGRP